VSQPLNRLCEHDALGDIDRDAGEFWVRTPFELPNQRKNLSAFERNRVYLNRHGRGFIDASFSSGADIDSDSRSVVSSDFDGDGVPDLLVSSVGGGPLRLFLNQIEQGNRLRLNLVGVTSNRAGIGTRLIAEVGDQVITRDVFPENGCRGLGPVRASIGTGSAGKIDRLTLRWPSGTIQRFTDVVTPASLTIREDKEELLTDSIQP